MSTKMAMSIRTGKTAKERQIKASGSIDKEAVKLYSQSFAGGATVQKASEVYLKKGDKGLSDMKKQGRDSKMVDAGKSIIVSIDNQPLEKVTAYRAVFDRPGKPTGFDSLKTGDSIPMKKITSFSTARDQTAVYTAKGQRNYEIVLTGKARGIHTDRLTGMKHGEFITAGEFKVVGISKGRKQKLPSSFAGSAKYDKIISVEYIGKAK